MWNTSAVLETFRALADPNRLQIVDLLFREPLPVGVIADRLGMRQPQATKHLQTLSNCGLVEVHQDAQRRIYSLRAQRLRELDVWLEGYRTLWEEQFERLDQTLEELQKTRNAGKKKSQAKARQTKRRPIR